MIYTHRVVTALFLASAVALGGCAGLGGGGTTGGGGLPSTSDINAIAAQVQNYCRIACGFAPTISTILSILTGGNPGVMTATSISQAICAAIAPPPAALGRRAFGPRLVKGWTVRPGSVNGVPVR